jgi:hypothetical protein
MRKPASPESSAPLGVETNLHNLAELLRKTAHLEPKAQQALAEIVDELAKALHSAPISNQEMIPLTQSTADLIHALHQRRDETVISTARDRLSRSILGVENQAPVVAQIAGRLLDALASSGI